MKIENSAKPVGGQTSGVRTPSARAGATAQPSAPATEVALSPQSSRLQQIDSAVANAPTMNADRVAEIRQAISDGSFKIDTGKIADGLIESVRQMLASQR